MSEDIPREYSEEELIKELVKILEELSRQTFDIRAEIEEIKKRRGSQPVITSLSEPEPEPLKSGYARVMESKGMQQTVETILKDYRRQRRGR